MLVVKISTPCVCAPHSHSLHEKFGGKGLVTLISLMIVIEVVHIIVISLIVCILFDFFAVIDLSSYFRHNLPDIIELWNVYLKLDRHLKKSDTDFLYFKRNVLSIITINNLRSKPNWPMRYNTFTKDQRIIVLDVRIRISTILPSILAFDLICAMFQQHIFHSIFAMFHVQVHQNSVNNRGILLTFIEYILVGLDLAAKDAISFSNITYIGYARYWF